MALTELKGSCRITVNRTAMTGERIFICDWSERKSVSPMLGDLFPEEVWLRCSSLDIEGFGKPAGPHSYEKAKITARYDTYQWIDDVPVESWEFGGEILETAIGRMWIGSGEICEQAYGVFYPSAIRTITLTLPLVPIGMIFNNLGKVNGNWFLDIPPEYALFEGCGATAHYAPDVQAYIYKVSFKFNVRSMPWNMVWRAPRQQRDMAGMLLYDDNGFPLWAEGAAGIGAWDRPYPYLYALADLGPMLGLASSPIIQPPTPPRGDGGWRAFTLGGQRGQSPTCGPGIGGSERIAI